MKSSSMPKDGLKRPSKGAKIRTPMKGTCIKGGGR